MSNCSFSTAFNKNQVFKSNTSPVKQTSISEIRPTSPASKTDVMSAQSISLKIKFKKKSSPTERGILTRYEHDCLRRCIGTATSLFIKLSPAALKCTGMLTSLLTYFLYTLPIRVYTFVFILR